MGLFVNFDALLFWLCYLGVSIRVVLIGVSISINYGSLIWVVFDFVIKGLLIDYDCFSLIMVILIVISCMLSWFWLLLFTLCLDWFIACVFGCWVGVVWLCWLTACFVCLLWLIVVLFWCLLTWFGFSASFAGLEWCLRRWLCCFDVCLLGLVAGVCELFGFFAPMMFDYLLFGDLVLLFIKFVLYVCLLWVVLFYGFVVLLLLGLMFATDVTLLLCLIVLLWLIWFVVYFAYCIRMFLFLIVYFA